jgi:outer membrane immunogenic protein
VVRGRLRHRRRSLLHGGTRAGALGGSGAGCGLRARRGAAPPANRAAPPPAPVAAPVYSWTGFYVGGNVGGTWSDDPINVNTTNLFFCPDTTCSGGPQAAAAFAQGTNGTFSGRSAGFIGGGQFGYNWQFNSWVAGFEADIQGTRVKATGQSNATVGAAGFGFSLTTNVSATKELDYLGTVRGRLGWLASPTMLVYGTGGLAYGEVKASTNVSSTITGAFDCTAGFCFPSTSAGISETRTGWTAGGGFEWMIVPQWSVKLEYLYYDLGRVTYNSLLVDPLFGFPVPNYFVNNVQTSTRFNGNIVRAGVNWHF